jgi:hypothetical protein
VGAQCAQYGLAFALPSLGGLVGSRLARPPASRFGQHRVLLVSGTLRAIWPIGLTFIRPGTPGLVLVMAVEFGLITCCGAFGPVYATYRLEHTKTDRVARTLAAWSVTNKWTTAALTAVWGVPADLAGVRTAIALAPRPAPASAIRTSPRPSAAPRAATARYSAVRANSSRARSWRCATPAGSHPASRSGSPERRDSSPGVLTAAPQAKPTSAPAWASSRWLAIRSRAAPSASGPPHARSRSPQKAGLFRR